MKKDLRAQNILAVAVEADKFYDKEDYEALVLAGDAGAKIVVKHSAKADGSGAEEFATYQLAADQTEVNVDLPGVLQYFSVTGANTLVFGDKRDVDKAIGIDGFDTKLYPHLDKPKSWGR